MVKNGFFWNNSKNIDISILRKEQNLSRSEFYMRVQSLVKIDWEMPVKNPRWPPRNLVFMSFQHQTAVISRASSWSPCIIYIRKALRSCESSRSPCSSYNWWWWCCSWPFTSFCRRTLFVWLTRNPINSVFFWELESTREMIWLWESLGAWWSCASYFMIEGMSSAYLSFTRMILLNLVHILSI